MGNAECKYVINNRCISNTIFRLHFFNIQSNFNGSNICGTMEFVRDIGSSSHWELFIAQGQKANENNLGMSFPSSIK